MKRKKSPKLKGTQSQQSFVRPQSTFGIKPLLLMFSALCCAVTPTQAEGFRAGSGDEFIVVDCLLPGQVRRLGNRVYVTRRRPVLAAAEECHIRGGEYVLEDRASISGSLQAWLPAALDGDIEAQNYVGELSERGKDGTPDYDMARFWYKRAADQGSAEAKFNLARLLEAGLGGPKDPEGAEELYRAAYGFDGEIATQVRLVDPAEIISLKSQLASQEQSLAEMEAEISRLNSELSNVSAQRSELLAQRDAARSQIAVLEQQLTEQRVDLSDEMQRRASAIAEISEQHSELTQTREALAQDEAALNAREEELAAKEAELEARLQQIAVSKGTEQEEITRLSTELAQARTAMEESQAARARALAERDAAFTQLAAQRNQIDAQLSDLASREKALAVREKTLSELQETASDISHNAEEIERQRGQVEQARRAIAADRATLSEDMAAYNANLAALQSRAASLSQKEQELADLRRELETKRTALSEVALDEAELNEQQTALADEKAALETQKASLQASQAAFEERLRSVTTREAALSVQIQELDTRAAALSLKEAEIEAREIQVTAKQAEAERQFAEAEDLRKQIEAAQQILAGGQRSLAPADGKAAEPPIEKIFDVNFGEYHALLIGNEEYEDPDWPDLDTSHNDVEAIDELLREKYGFKTTVLKDATRFQILKAINDLGDQLGENDNLLIYYAGHGQYIDQVSIGYWEPVDSIPYKTVNSISVQDINTQLSLTKAHKVLVVSDSCYSGAFTRAPYAMLTSGAEFEAKEKYLKQIASKRSRNVMTAGGLQPVADGLGNGHSLFAGAFIAALAENDDIALGRDVFSKVRDVVTLSATHFNWEQEPEYDEIVYSGHEGGDFIFVPLAP